MTYVDDVQKFLKSLQEGVDFLKTTAVYVGIPQEANAQHPGSPYTNAELLYLHESGVPSQNIPPRPVMKIAWAKEDTKQAIKECLQECSRLAMHGKIAEAREELQAAGMEGVNKIKDTFGSAQLAPNSPVTIALKGSSAPLIDTGQLRNAITYVVRKE